MKGRAGSPNPPLSRSRFVSGWANGRLGEPSLPTLRGIPQLDAEGSWGSTCGRRAPCYPDAACPPDAVPSSPRVGRPPRPLVRDDLLPPPLPDPPDDPGDQSGDPGGLGSGPRGRPAGAAALYDHARSSAYGRSLEPCPGAGSGGRRSEALAGQEAGDRLAAGFLRPSAQNRVRIQSQSPLCAAEPRTRGVGRPAGGLAPYLEWEVG